MPTLVTFPDSQHPLHHMLLAVQHNHAATHDARYPQSCYDKRGGMGHVSMSATCILDKLPAHGEWVHDHNPTQAIPVPHDCNCSAIFGIPTSLGWTEDRTQSTRPFV